MSGGDTFSGGGESAAELREDVERLEQLLLQQHKRLEAIENGDLTPPTQGQKSSRRDLLRKAGLAAAAATGGLIFVEAAPASATTGGDFLLGKINDADTTTTLVPTAGSASTELLFVDNEGGNSQELTGILGYGSTGGSGVVGYAPSTKTSAAGIGIYGFNTAGIAVAGASIGSQPEGGGFFGGIDLAAMGLGRIMQVSNVTTGPPVYTPNEFEQVRDSSGGLWLSQSDKTDNISNISPWRPSLSFVPLATPVRKISGTELALGAAPTLSADLRDGTHIPGNAVGIAGNLAMTVHAFASRLNGAGVLAIAPGGTSQVTMGGIASINSGNGALADSNHVAVGFGTGSDAGKVSLYYYGGGGPPSHIDVYLDVVGYFV